MLIELTACNAVLESVHCHRHPTGRRPIVHSSMKTRNMTTDFLPRQRCAMNSSMDLLQCLIQRTEWEGGTNGDGWVSMDCGGWAAFRDRWEFRGTRPHSSNVSHASLWVGS
ncbi:hypothetical protein M0804_008973 [Polistes exclamans]|nr:hypothetical protein M0804_008973 [Polistes exclamans]